MTTLTKRPERSRRRAKGLALLTAATVAGTSAFATAPAAFADAGDGTITVTVVNDLNYDSRPDSGDEALNNVRVRITDAAGRSLTRQTDGDGVVRLAASDAGNNLVGGQYRIEVTNPDTRIYSEAYVAAGREGFAPATSFVDVSGGTDVEVAVGYYDATKVGYSNATIYSAVQPDSIWPTGRPGALEVYQSPYRLNSPATAITTEGTLGTLYGIGLDREKHEIYAGAFAKRGSAYGPGGPGAIYRIDPSSGAWEQYVTVADAGTTGHDFDELIDGHEAQDFSFRTAVGRESLGDVEVTEDAKYLLAINMHTDSVVVYPVQDEVNPAPIQTLSIPAIDCPADWAPMAITENTLDGSPNEGKIYIGATCGATMQTSIIEYDISASGELSPTGTVWTGDPTTAPGSTGENANNLAHAECTPVDWRPWTDEIPQPCIDHANLTSPPRPGGIQRQFTIAQPMLSDIEFLENGELVLAFRDRGGDQYGPILYYGTRTDGRAAYADYIVAGNVHAVSIDGSTIDYDARSDAPRGGDFLDKPNGYHSEAAFGGIVYVPGTERIVGNQMDGLGIYQQGLRAWDPLTGNLADSATGTPDQTVTRDFRKGQGLADMEAFYRLVDQQIGNRIWIDSDSDGVQDPGEPSVAGVQVSLYDEHGELIATTETDENGEYYFSTADGLKPETKYEVRLDRSEDFEVGGPLAGLAPTRVNRGGAELDSNGRLVDVDGTMTVLADVTTPAEGINDHSIDFGFLPPNLVSIGDYVWIDANGDGLQGDTTAEPPVAGVLIQLLNADGEVVDEAETDENGFYFFANLPANTEYTVSFPVSVRVDGQRYELTQQGSNPAAGNDSNADPETGLAPVVTPGQGENRTGPNETDNPTIDAGYVLVPDPQFVSVGDYLWIDADGDGTQDASEDPVAGATVKLLDSRGNLIAETTTDENGYYAFTDLDPSTDYIIEFPTSVTVDGVELQLTEPGRDSDPANDSNPATDTGRAPFTSPASGNNSAEPGEADDPTIDAGYVLPPAAPVSIGDYLWLDENGDGLQGEGEYPLSGATVRLLDADGNLVKTTTSDANGYYVFTDLRPSTEYIVEFPTSVTHVGETYVLTEPGAGDDPAVDSNPSQVTGRAPVVTPESGNNSAEPGQADDPTIDAGYVLSPDPLVSIGDYVWIDENRDGLQGDDEAPAGGVTVRLLDLDGNVVATTTTSADGYYAFANLPINTDFIVEFPTTITVGGVEHGLTVQGTDPEAGNDSNADPATGQALVTTPAGGSNRTAPGEADIPTIDAGYAPPAPPVLVSIGDYLWIDTDGDGTQGAAERPLPGVEVKLLDASGEVVTTTTTDENGYYVFTDLAPSTEYIVEFPTRVTVDGEEHTLTEPGRGGDPANDSNPAVDTGRAPVTTPASGSNSAEPGQADDPTIDAGYVPVPPVLVSVGDYLWIDANRDGLQGEGEKPVAGATVKLLDLDGATIATTTTDANGYYVFADLPASTDYVIEFPTSVTIDGIELGLTARGQGSNPALDSNADPATGLAPVTTPATGSNSSEPGEADNPTIDAGYVKPLVSVGDFVWLDANGDGVQNAGERPVPGIEVKLYDENGKLLRTTTTDENGFYVFTDLIAGEKYSLEFPTSVTIDGKTHKLTRPGQGGDPAKDSNADQQTGRVSFTAPASGNNSALPGQADNPTLDAGFAPEEVLVITGAEGGQGAWIAAGGGLLLLAGGLLLTVRRKRIEAEIGSE